MSTTSALKDSYVFKSATQAGYSGCLDCPLSRSEAGDLASLLQQKGVSASTYGEGNAYFVCLHDIPPEIAKAISAMQAEGITITIDRTKEASTTAPLQPASERFRPSASHTGAAEATTRTGPAGRNS